MPIFDDPSAPSVLEVKQVAGAERVDAQGLLDFLEMRGIMAERMAIVPNIDERIADFQRGRFEELSALYKLVQKQCQTKT